MTINEPTVYGAGVISIIEGMGEHKNKARSIFRSHGLPDLIYADQWYSLEAVSKVLLTIAEQLGPEMVRKIGRRIPEFAAFPPRINSFEKALYALEIGYGLNHRGTNIGSYSVTQLSETEFAVDSDAYYPCELDMGLIEAMVTRFSVGDHQASVYHDDTDPCRKRGDNQCRYRIN
jgi:hypothetical protein